MPTISSHWCLLGYVGIVSDFEVGEDIRVLTRADHSHGGHGAPSLQVAKVEAPVRRMREEVMSSAQGELRKVLILRFTVVRTYSTQASLVPVSTMSPC